MHTALEKKETTVENALDYRGVPVIAVTKYLDKLDFGIVVKMDRDELFTTSYELKVMILQIIIVLIVIVILVSILLSYMITKPVIDITQAAILISHGDFEKRVEKLSQDELGQLARALNEMADKLINSNNILESKVKERTHKLQQANKKLEKLSLTDGLTGIANRAKFDKSIDEIFRRCIRYKKPLSLLIIDIDYFKAVNDTYGHQTGDKYLKKVASVIKDCAERVDDLPARYGGEEFALILEDTYSEGAELIANRVRQKIHNCKLENINSKVDPYLTASIGISTILPHKNTDLKSFIKEADKALYKAKDEGRNRVVAKDNI
jgi:diguanylate cyclase (GGDEF)-like protein